MYLISISQLATTELEYIPSPGCRPSTDTGCTSLCCVLMGRKNAHVWRVNRDDKYVLVKQKNPKQKNRAKNKVSWKPFSQSEPTKESRYFCFFTKKKQKSPMVDLRTLPRPTAQSRPKSTDVFGHNFRSIWRDVEKPKHNIIIFCVTSKNRQTDRQQQQQQQQPVREQQQQQAAAAAAAAGRQQQRRRKRNRTDRGRANEGGVALSHPPFPR